MIELTQTNDPIRLGWLTSRLTEAGVVVHVFDAHTASLYGGALLQITQRVFVDERDIATARLILAEAERIAAADTGSDPGTDPGTDPGADFGADFGADGDGADPATGR